MRRDITEKPQRDDRDTASLRDRPKRQQALRRYYAADLISG